MNTLGEFSFALIGRQHKKIIKNDKKLILYMALLIVWANVY